MDPETAVLPRPKVRRRVYAIGDCSRCGRKILSDEGEIIMLKASHYKMDKSTYTIEMTLCENCNHSFEKWTIFKGDDTV